MQGKDAPDKICITTKIDINEEVSMKRTLMAAVAVGGLMLSTAFAQSPAPTPNTADNPSASQSAPPPAATPSTPAPSAAPAAPASPTAQAPAPSTSAKVITQQSPDQFLASKFKGTNVIGTNDEKVGDVSDILFDKNGKVDAIIVGVGGFLGIGAKDVALALSSFQVVKGSNGAADKLRLSMSKDELKQMAEFKPLAPPTTTTGTAPSGSSPRPASPMAPRQ